MSDTVKLIGLDFGTTTSSAVVASARLARSGVTGRVELSGAREGYRSDMVFTPLRCDDILDEGRLERAAVACASRSGRRGARPCGPSA